MDIEKLKQAPRIVVEVLDCNNIDGSFIRRLMVKQNISPSKMSTVLQVSRKKLFRMCKSNRYVKGSTAMLLALIEEDPSVVDTIVRVSMPKKSEDETVNDFMLKVKEML